MNIDQLGQIYREAKDNNHALACEQRSNLQLVAGNHYARANSEFRRALSRIENITKTQKIRLTKNHIQRISKTYRNECLALSAGVALKPKNENEMQDQKTTEMYSSAWAHIKEEAKWTTLFPQMVQDFIDLGEIWLKLFYDYNKGGFIGYELEIDEDGKPVLDDEDEPVAHPVFEGGHVFERIHGFNLLTDPGARSWEEAQYVIYLKMMPTEELKKKYQDNEKVYSAICSSSDQTYKVFDTTNGSYYDTSKMTMIREFYFRPSYDNPNGYYYITVEGVILDEGELPEGIFPIIRCGFDDLPTSPRAHSIIKQLRPFQAEINRCASKIAEHQITIGDDKLVLKNGSRVSQGATTHGVKTIRVNGGDIQYLPGRSGGQYLENMKNEISEMYEAANLQELRQDKRPEAFDPLGMLYATVKDKKKFTLYVDKLVEFQKEVCRTALKLAKIYWDENKIVPVVGRKETVNIPEFKCADDLTYRFVVEEQSEDVESKMGRHITMSHILQYVGQNLDRRELGAVIRSLPYFNKEEVTLDLTIDYDNIRNDILALDRGEIVDANEWDDHDYVLKHLTRRMKQADFKQLSPEIQQAYHQKKDAHRQIRQMQIQAEQAAQSGFIPSDGYLVTCDFYVPHPVDPSKNPRKARIPYSALEWLIKKLDQQGMSQQQLEQMNDQLKVEMMQSGAFNSPPALGQGQEGQIINMS